MTKTKSIIFFLFIIKSLIINLNLKLFNYNYKKSISDDKKNTIDTNKNCFLYKKIYEKCTKGGMWLLPFGNKFFFKKKQIEKNIIDYSLYNSSKNKNIDYLSKNELKLRLKKINKKSQIKIIKYNNIVYKTVLKYLRAGKYIGKIISLSNYYFPMFEEKLEKYGIPIELKYLAIVESSLNPIIISNSGAKGIWQFMPKTGKSYNLHTKNVYDERNDPVKSTEAACRYLKYLYMNIGNWELSLAAYNSGPNIVNKILKRGKNKKNFWKLWISFPNETKNYVPKFIAVNYIMNYYKKHNISSYIHFPKYSIRDTILIPVRKKTRLIFVSDILNIPIHELVLLNPKYSKGVSKKNNLLLRIPRNKIFLLKYRSIIRED
ncbi:lytic transglycosylase domain-containing protein [Blattabacterium cuenoti]|uniref:lytic transglycosylase domain-containing protein n=1 Tax=Blattabacterium cuenoti TaxID=1653831 RepID=UPI00163CF1D2|nr:lytic transglycosylase domain-containing protein [Blattabacterium cuenoti]